MQFTHLPIAGAFLATLALIVFVINRQTGFESITTFLLSTAAYGIGWICTFVLLLVLVNRGGFDWLPVGTGLRYLAVITLHLAVGGICIRGLLDISDSHHQWWIWPCFALATLVPLLIEAAALTRVDAQRLLLMTVIGVESVAALTVPVVLLNRAVERDGAAFRGESAGIEALPKDAAIVEYLYYIKGNHEPGIPELAARTMAVRADHTAVIVAALHGAGRLDAMRLLGVKGIPATPALAAAVGDAITIATEEVRARRAVASDDYGIDIETMVAGDAAEQFGAYSAQLIPVLEKLVDAAGPMPPDRVAGEVSGRQHIHDWLLRVKGTR